MRCQQDPQTCLIVRPTRTSSFGLRPAPRRVWCVSVFLTLSYPCGSHRVSCLAVAEAASEQLGKPPGPSRTIRRSAASEPSGCMPGPSRSEPSAKAIYASRLVGRRACVEPSAEARHVRAAAHTTPSTERSVEQPVAAEPRTIQHSSHSQRAPQIPNRTP